LTLQTRVPADAAGLSLLEFLVARFRYHGIEAWGERITDGRVRLNDRRVGPDERLARGDRVAYDRPSAEPDVPTDVRIVHDAGGVVVVDKPAGLPVHGDGTFITRTVVGVLARELGTRLRPVQRLDRETSGLCVLARTRAAARDLQQALGDPSAHKEYDALGFGVADFDARVVDLPIGRAAGSAVSIRRGVAPPDDSTAQVARTDVRVHARGGDRTWFRCVLATGRTHQIRVHLEALGHPLLGDKLYGRSDEDFLAFVRAMKSGESPDSQVDGLGARRQMLHARVLAFPEPGSAGLLRFEVEPPMDFRGLAPGPPG
jgi:23S rRNA pseudouridine1911/1915/1917 synthase